MSSVLAYAPTNHTNLCIYVSFIAVLYKACLTFTTGGDNKLHNTCIWALVPIGKGWSRKQEVWRARVAVRGLGFGMLNYCSDETSYTTIYYWCWPQINKTHAWCTYRALSLGARNRECEGSSHCLRVLAVGGSGGVENGALRRALWASDGMSGSWRRPTWRIRGVVGMTVCKLQVMMAGSPSCGHLGMRVDDREVCVFLFLDWIGNCLIWLNVNYQLGWLVV